MNFLIVFILIPFVVYSTRSCKTIIEIFDDIPGSNKKKPIHKICSPQTKHTRDNGGTFLEHQTFVSSGPTMTLLLKRQLPPHQTKDYEYVDGAYLFHDGKLMVVTLSRLLCVYLSYRISFPIYFTRK